MQQSGSRSACRISAARSGRPGVVGRGKPRVDPGDEVAVTDIPEKEEQRVCGLVQTTIAKVVPGDRASAEMSGFRTGVGGLHEPAFGELPVARQPRARWPLPKRVLDFLEENRAVLVHVALGDGV